METLLQNSPAKNKQLNSVLDKVYIALQYYSNVHRGSGHKSMVTTHLYEKARQIVLNYLHYSKNKYDVIFCSPYLEKKISQQIQKEYYTSLSSNDFGLAIGIRAMAIRRDHLPKEILFSGGGNTRLIGKNWVVWSKGYEKFEAGTPAIISVILFACTLQIAKNHKSNSFLPDDYTLYDSIFAMNEFEEYSGHELLTKLKETEVGKQVTVPVSGGDKQFVNLDNAASTPTFDPIWETFTNALQINPEHNARIIDSVKNICSSFINAPLNKYDILFTSNTTEAINIVSESLSEQPSGNENTLIINTILEHSSNDLPWRRAKNHSLLRIDANENGLIHIDSLDALLQEQTNAGKTVSIVAVSGASNVLGTCNNLRAISKIVHSYGAKLLVDGAQLVAHRAIDIEILGIDYFVFSAHKMYAPFGSGALIARKGLLEMSAYERETIRKSGEENVAGIAAMGKSILLLQKIGMDVAEHEEQKLSIRLLVELSKIKGITIYGIDPNSAEIQNRLGVVVFQMKGLMADKTAKHLFLNGGIGVRYGCHCSHMLVKKLLGIEPRLEKFQKLFVTLFPKMQLPGLTRVSLGLGNTSSDIDRLVEELRNVGSRLDKKHIAQMNDAFLQKISNLVYTE